MKYKQNLISCFHNPVVDSDNVLEYYFMIGGRVRLKFAPRVR